MMKLAQFVFTSCKARSSKLEVFLIRCAAVVLGLIGAFHSYYWVRWLIVPFVPHPRAWLDPYSVIGIPVVIFAVGLFQISRLFVLLTVLAAFLIALFFTVGAFQHGALLNHRAIIAILSFLLFSGRLTYIGLSK